MIETPPERLVHNKMFKALLPSICIYFHLVVKYLLHSIMSHILGLISKTLSSCASHQLHWDVWVLSTAENQVSPPFWSHTNSTKEVAGKKYFFLPPIMFPTMYVLLISTRNTSKLLDMAQEHPCLWKEQRVRTHSLLAGWKHQSLQPNTWALSVCQQTHRCSTIVGSCTVCVHMRKCQFKGIKNIWLACMSYNRTLTVMAIYHCPSSQIFPEFLAHVGGRIYSR